MVVFVVIGMSIMRSFTAHWQPRCVDGACPKLWLESEAQKIPTRDCDANSWLGGASHAVEGCGRDGWDIVITRRGSVGSKNDTASTNEHFALPMAPDELSRRGLR